MTAVRGVLRWIAVICCTVNFAACHQFGNLTDEQRRKVVDALTGRLESDGYKVQEGEVFYFLVQDCLDMPSCYGNNASSPYGMYLLPPAGNESNADDRMPIDRIPAGLSNVWRLRQDEAIFYLGRTPPPAAYFSFRSYVFRRTNPETGNRVDVFASLGDTVNVANIATVGTPEGRAGNPFDAETVVITTGSRDLDARLRELLVEEGIPAYIFNTDEIPSTILSMGLEETADTFTMLNRVALFEDVQRGEAYMEDPPAIVLRITPEEELPVDLFGAPELKPRGKGTNEDHLANAVNILKSAILEEFSSLNASSLFTFSVGFQGPYCIENYSYCAGEVRDTTYALAPDFTLPDDPDEFYIVYGINHEATGKASYSNVVVMNAARSMGVTGVESTQMAGSADRFLPDHPDKDALFAYKIARNCDGEAFCVSVSTDLPGIGLDESVGFVFRAYLEPGMEVGPSPDELLRSQVIRFSKRLGGLISPDE